MTEEGNFPREKGLMGRVDHKQWWREFPRNIPIATKIVFLNKKNLAELKGYKASVDLCDGLGDHNEIHIILTGFSYQGAKDLFDKLKALPKDEIYSKDE